MKKWADCEGCQVADRAIMARNQIRRGITADNERVQNEILLEQLSN